jgi:hypothetical protein
MKHIENFSQSPPSVTVLKNDKEKFKSALRNYIKTHLFYSVDELFVWRWFIIFFCKILLVFYALKIVHTCVFKTCSTYYCLCDTLTNPWNVCMYVRMHVHNVYVVIMPGSSLQPRWWPCVPGATVVNTCWFSGTRPLLHCSVSSMRSTGLCPHWRRGNWSG